MTNKLSDQGVRVFTTFPPSSVGRAGSYLEDVGRIAEWSERAGCAGALIYSDNNLVDPWLIAQAVIARTARLVPLIAVQPVYMHPYTAAKLVASLGFMYHRRVCLNLVAGGFTKDLAALNDLTPHDERYARLIEYARIVTALLMSSAPVTMDGQYYRVANLKLSPALDPALLPELFVSGSSAAGLAAAAAVGALAVQYPRPVADYETEPLAPGQRSGIRVGVVARETDAEAWEVAHQRFPADRQGQLTHQLAMKASDSRWHQQLSTLGQDAQHPGDVYWTFPFENYKTFCPYLVGSYDRVAEELARYIGVGCSTIILDVPANEAELEHIGTALSRTAHASAR